MPELIDRYATMDAIPAPTDADEAEYYGKVCDAIEAMPTIEAEPVRHGHWENIPGMNNTVFCSECLAAANKELAMKYKGCPFCLARMDGGAYNG